MGVWEDVLISVCKVCLVSEPYLEIISLLTCRTAAVVMTASLRTTTAIFCKWFESVSWAYFEELWKVFMKLHEWEVDWLFDWKFDGIYLVRSPHQNYHPSDLSRRSSPCLSDHTHTPHPESSHVHPPNDSHRHSYRRKMWRFVVEGWWGMPSGWQRVGYGDGFRGCVRGCTRGNLMIKDEVLCRRASIIEATKKAM